MRRKASRFTAFAAAAALMAGLPLAAPSAAFTTVLTVQAEDNYTQGMINSMQYAKYDDHVAIIGYDYANQQDSYEIPATIDGLPVTSIEIYAFNGCGLTSIVIPDSVTYIGKYAFTMCQNLTSVTLPDSIEHIDTCAFQQCFKLATVELPDHTVKLGSCVFDESPWLEGLRAKDPLVIVNDMLIDGVNCEGDVVVPSNVKAIAGGAFYGNTKLTSITAPTSVKEINESTFWQCENLVSADLKGVENIGVTAFGYCAKLNEMKLPGKMKTIETYAFCDCTSHATITVFGTEAEWSQVQILDSSSDFLKNATYIFDSTPIEDPPQEIVGDVDGDGAFTVLDVVALQRWLLAIPGATLADPDAADMDKNEILDVFDLGLMKRALLKQ